MNRYGILLVLVAATALISTSTADAQRYYARQSIGKRIATATSPAAPVAQSVCETPQPRLTITNYGTLKFVGQQKSIAAAKIACETEVVAVCYVIEDTTPSTGSVFYPYTSTKGSVTSVGYFPGQENYASYCRAK